MRTFWSIMLSIAGAALVLAAGARNESVVKMRASYHLTSSEPLENAPPVMVFTTVALGGFSGLITDVLWLRASYLQDEGKYIELVQLADWITKLEPRVTDIWEFQAWNMAYNVSVMLPDNNDRWRWVRSGIQLLRDDGIRYNAGDPRLYLALGWLFLDKIGGRTDDANMFYKQEWAVEMTALLGGPNLDYDKLASDPERARRLREEYKLDPGIMRRIDAEYGPLDWRLAQTHAIYWAVRAKEHTRGSNLLDADRMIFQSMAASFLRGRLQPREGDNALMLGPNPDLLQKTMQVYETALNTYKDPSVKASYANFLRSAAATLHGLGRKEEAVQLFNTARGRFPDEVKEDFDTLISNAYQKNRLNVLKDGQ